MENEIEICVSCKSPNWRNLSHLEKENPHGVCMDCGSNNSEWVDVAIPSKLETAESLGESVHFNSLMQNPKDWEDKD